MPRLAQNSAQVALNQRPADLRGKARALGVFGRKIAILLAIAAHREAYWTEGELWSSGRLFGRK